MSNEWSVPAPRCRRPSIPVLVVSNSRDPATGNPARVINWFLPPDQVEAVLHRAVRSEQGHWFNSLRELLVDLRSENSTASGIRRPVCEIPWRPFDWRVTS